MNDTTEYWERQARRYDRAALILNRRFAEMTEAVAAAVSGAGSVLEVAAGTGLVTAMAAPAVGRYLATDSTAGMLEVLRRRLEGPPNLEVRLADAQDLDLPDNSFDAVIIANVLHLLPDPAGALEEAKRVLRPGGLLVAPTFCHGEGRLARSVSHLLTATGFPVVTRFRGDDLDALVSEASFEVEDARWFEGLLPIRFLRARTQPPCS